MKWVEKFPCYWGLIDQDGTERAHVIIGRVSFMAYCGEKSNQFGFTFSFMKRLQLKKAQKWCEGIVKKC